MNKGLKIAICIGAITILGSNAVLIRENNKYISDVDKHIVSDIDIVAHRGVAYGCLENTKNSINNGINMECVDSIEIDVRMTSDNKIVLSHNSYFRTLFTNVLVKNSSLNELSQIKIKSNLTNDLKDYYEVCGGVDFLFHNKFIQERLLCTDRVCTLEDALKLMSTTTKELLIDIKFDSNYEDMISELNSLISNNKGVNVCFQSTSLYGLNLMKTKYPNYQYQLIVNKNESLDDDFDRYAISDDIVTYGMVDSLISEDKDVSIWTVDTKKQFDVVLNTLGSYADDVSYITDYPDSICYLYGKQLLK